MIGNIDPSNLPDSFHIHGQEVKYALVKNHLKEVFGAPVAGYVIECKGSDEKSYFLAARVLFDRESDGFIYRSGWDVEFYSTKKAASLVLRTGHSRVFSGNVYDYEEAA